MSNSSKLASYDDYKESLAKAEELARLKLKLKESIKIAVSTRNTDQLPTVKPLDTSSSYLQDSKSIADHINRITMIPSVNNMPISGVIHSSNMIQSQQTTRNQFPNNKVQLAKTHNRKFPSHLVESNKQENLSDIDSIQKNCNQTPVNSFIRAGFGDSLTNISPPPQAPESAGKINLEGVLQGLQSDMKEVFTLCEELKKFQEEIRDKLRNQVHTRLVTEQTQQPAHTNNLLRNNSSRVSLINSNSNSNNQTRKQSPLQASRIQHRQMLIDVSEANNPEGFYDIRTQNTMLKSQLARANSYIKILKLRNRELLGLFEQHFPVSSASSPIANVVQYEDEEMVANFVSTFKSPTRFEPGFASSSSIGSSREIKDYSRGQNTPRGFKSMVRIKQLPNEQPSTACKSQSVQKMFKQIHKQLDNLCGFQSRDQQLREALAAKKKYEKFLNKLKGKLSDYFEVKGWDQILKRLSYRRK